MKLTKDHVGKKVRQCFWTPGEYIVLQGFDIEDCGYGIDEKGLLYTGEDDPCNEWELINEPKDELSLLEAMKSDKDFCVVGEAVAGYFSVDNEALYFDGVAQFVTTHLLSLRYELKPEPKKVEVTAESLDKIVIKFLNSDGYKSVKEYQDFLKKELNLD